MERRILLTVALVAGLCLACQSTPEVFFEDVEPADVLFDKGIQELDGRKILWVYRRVNYVKAIEIFQSIIDNYPYSEYAVEAELKIADAYFDDGKYEEALSYYRDFSDLHPDHAKVPYSIYRSALCHETQVEDELRDQTSTRSALLFLDRLLVRHPHSDEARLAEPLWRTLQVRLAENVEQVADFYRSRQEYEAAAERYRALLNDHPGLGLDARVLYKLGDCYARLRRTDEADRIFRTLVVHYRDSRYAFEAKQRLASNLEDLN
ncbi:MAG: outer membrane protein assembly factor BamD [Myxococcota bacterium]